METLTNFLWAVLPGLVTGVALAIWNRKQKKRDDDADRREKERKRSEVIQLDLIVATAELSHATAIAIKNGTTNGEMKEGLRQYNRAIQNLREFEREKIAE